MTDRRDVFAVDPASHKGLVATFEVWDAGGSWTIREQWWADGIVALADADADVVATSIRQFLEGTNRTGNIDLSALDFPTPEDV